MEFKVGDRVKTNTHNKRSPFNNKSGKVVKIDYSMPMPIRIEFDEQVMSSGVWFNDMIFYESEVQID